MSFIEWFFSGAGTIVLGIVLKHMFKSDGSSQANSSVSLHENKAASQAIEEAEVTEAQMVSVRMAEALKLLNSGRFQPYTVSDLAQFLDLKRVSELEEFITGQREPSFEFLELFAFKLGLNYEWLTSGHSSPYRTTVKHLHFPEDYLGMIEEQSPESIYFVKCRDECCKMFIVLKHSDLKYSICPMVWHISGHVGAGGSRQLYSFYKMLQRLHENNFYSRCYGVVLDEKEFHNLLNGDVFPRTVLRRRNIDYWFDDFSDIHHKYPIAERYRELHGEEFLRAQDIVKDCI